LEREAPRHPTRTCVGCRAVRPQHELLRVAATPDGIRFDHRRRLPGRGAYLCPDPGCLDAATRRGAGALRRALRGAPEAEAMAALDAVRTHLSGDPTGDEQHQVQRAP
jgi:predicted RNA-binding protein YlxR (DUF448 family)